MTNKLDEIRSGLMETLGEHFYELIDALEVEGLDEFESAISELEKTIDTLENAHEAMVDLGLWADRKRVRKKQEFAADVIRTINAL